MPKVLTSTRLLNNDAVNVSLTSSLSVCNPTEIYQSNSSIVASNTLTILELLVPNSKNRSIKLSNSQVEVIFSPNIFAANIVSVVSNTINSTELLVTSPDKTDSKLNNTVSTLTSFSVSTGSTPILYDPLTASQIWYTS